MLLVDKVPDIRFDVAKFKMLLKPYLYEAMEKATDELLKSMQIHVYTVTAVGKTGKGAPGDLEWRNELDRDLEKLYVRVVDDIVEGAVGANAGYGEGDNYFVRAMLIAYGSGNRAVSPNPITGKKVSRAAIHAGPHGREVWDDDLMDHVDGGSHSSYHKMPQSFNQIGNFFPEKALEDVRAHFEQIVGNALRNIPPNILMQCLIQ